MIKRVKENWIFKETVKPENMNEVGAALNELLSNFKSHEDSPQSHPKLQVIGQWRPNEKVDLNFIRYPNNIAAYNVRLVCAKAGITDRLEPEWPSPGNSIQDGSAIWSVTSSLSGSKQTYAEKIGWKSSEKCKVGYIRFPNSGLSGRYVLECIEIVGEGFTGTIEPGWTSPGSKVEDNEVIWLVRNTMDFVADQGIQKIAFGDTVFYSGLVPYLLSALVADAPNGGSSAYYVFNLSFGLPGKGAIKQIALGYLSMEVWVRDWSPNQSPAWSTWTNLSQSPLRAKISYSGSSQGQINTTATYGNGTVSLFTQPGMPRSVQDLQSTIQGLVKLSHSHSQSNWNCNCDCQCDCSGDTDGGG